MSIFVILYRRHRFDMNSDLWTVDQEFDLAGADAGLLRAIFLIGRAIQRAAYGLLGHRT